MKTAEEIDLSGWVLIAPETDEFYGQVQLQNEHGMLTDKKETVERSILGYRFCQPGLGKLTIIKRFNHEN